MSRKPSEKPEKPPSEAEKRRARLAEALRANLKRRKTSKAPSAGKDGEH